MSFLFDDSMRTVSTLRRLPVRAARIGHCHQDGLHATIVRRKEVREFHVTIEPLPGEGIGAMVRRLQSFLMGNGALMVRQEVFGSTKLFSEFERATRSAFGEVNWPVVWAEGLPCERTGIAGIHALGIAGTEIETVWNDEQAAGTVFSDGFARHCILGGILPHQVKAVRADQARDVFNAMTTCLQAVELDFRHVARTWLYLADIVDWYKQFNVVRKEEFQRHDVFSHCVPASTGIGAKNLAGAGLVAGAWAVQPLDEFVSVEPVVSPLQCSAHDYGSCFSRAVEVSSPDLSRLWISGTASIAADGTTQHIGDVRKQVELTMEVVRAILTSRQMGWHDVSRATAYVKRAADAWAFAEYEVEHDLNLPVVVTEADVCRKELLFEIEVDALAPAGPNLDWEI